MRTIITLKPTADGKTRITRDQWETIKRYSGGWILLEGAGTDGGSWLVKGPSGERKVYNNRTDAESHINADRYGHNFDSRDAKDMPVITPTIEAAGGGWRGSVGSWKGPVRSSRTTAEADAQAQARSAFGGLPKGHSWMSSAGESTKNLMGDAKDLFIGTRGLSQEREDGHLDHAYNEEKGFKIPPPKDPKERAEWEAGVARRKAEGKGTFVGDSANRRKIVVHNHLPRVKVNDEDNAAALQARGRGLVDVYTKSIDVRDWCKRQSLGRAQEAFVLTGWKQARKESGLSENV